MVRRGVSLAERFRVGTLAAHKRLDHHEVLAPLVRRDLTVDAYGRALAALHGPQAEIERCLAGHAPAGQFPPRLPDLDADLDALGVQPFPVAGALPVGSQMGLRIGVMYVIEGSNLGGQVIARQVAQQLPYVPMRFFGGAAGVARWQSFWAFAAERLDPADEDLAIQSARDTFDFYLNHLNIVLESSCAVSR